MEVQMTSYGCLEINDTRNNYSDFKKYPWKMFYNEQGPTLEFKISIQFNLEHLNTTRSQAHKQPTATVLPNN